MRHKDFSSLHPDAAVSSAIQKCMSLCRMTDLLQADCFDKLVNLRKDIAQYKEYFKEL